MSIKYTPNTLKKLEQLFEEARFRVRYEKGTFSSGYCLLENRKIAVINRFLNIEGRINAMIEILPQLEINVEELSDEMKKLYLQYGGGAATNSTGTTPSGEDPATDQEQTEH